MIRICNFNQLNKGEFSFQHYIGLYMHLNFFLNLTRFLFGLVLTSSIFGLSHEERLRFFKKRGFRPKIIYDIGAHHGDWTRSIQSIFPRANFYMFEANEQHAPQLEKVGHPFFLGVLGSHNGPVTFFSINGTGDSIFRELTYLYEKGSCHEETKTMSTLKKVVQDNQLPLPDLIKIDVQGAEKMIIEGSIEVITNAEIILLETNILRYNEQAPLAAEVITLMDKIGYNILDIAELHYLTERSITELIQVDFIFVKKNSSLFRSGLLVKRQK